MLTTNTQAYNRYTYCLNNPLKYTDPSGWVAYATRGEMIDDPDASRGGGGGGIGYVGNINTLVGNTGTYNYFGSYSMYTNNQYMYGSMYGNQTLMQYVVGQWYEENQKKNEDAKNYHTGSTLYSYKSNDPKNILSVVGMMNRGNDLDAIFDNMTTAPGITIYGTRIGGFSVDMGSLMNTWQWIQDDLDGIDYHDLSQTLRKIAGYANAIGQPFVQAWDRANKYGKPFSNSKSLVWFEKAVKGFRIIRTPAIEISTKTVQQIGNTMKGIRYVAGGAGIVFGLYDIYNNGLNTSNGLDLAMSGLALTGFGSGIATIYFISNLAIQFTTGRDIGQHIDSWIKH